MTEQTTLSPPVSRWHGIVDNTRRHLLLVPEAMLICMLTVAGIVSGGAPLFGLIGAATFLVFVVRIGALYMGRLALSRAQYGEAASMSHLSLAFHPFSADALALRGQVLLAEGCVDEAAELLDRSVQLFPGRADTLAALAGARLGQGYWSAARIAAIEAIELDASCAAAFLYLAEAEQAAGVALPEVEDTLRSGLAVATRPDDETALRCALAGVLLSVERSAETALVLGGVESLLLRCSPGYQTRLRLRYGELLLAQGLLEKAREYLNETVVIGPQANAPAC